MPMHQVVSIRRSLKNLNLIRMGDCVHSQTLKMIRKYHPRLYNDNVKVHAILMFSFHGLYSCRIQYQLLIICDIWWTPSDSCLSNCHGNSANAPYANLIATSMELTLRYSLEKWYRCICIFIVLHILYFIN